MAGDSITLAQAAKMQQDPLMSGVIETIITTDELQEVLKYSPIEGLNLQFSRVSSRGDNSDWLAVNGALASPNKALASLVNLPLNPCVAEFELNKLIAAQGSQQNDQQGFQVAQATMAIGENFSDKIFNGLAASNEPTGIVSQIIAGQKVACDTDGLLTYNKLGQAINKVKLGKAERVIVSHSNTLLFFEDMMRASGNTVQHQSDWFGRPVAMFKGIPWIVNDNIVQTDGDNADRTKVYIMSLNDGVGVHGFYAGNIGSMGFEVAPLGRVSAYYSDKYQIAWNVGLAMKSPLALAEVNNISLS